MEKPKRKTNWWLWVILALLAAVFLFFLALFGLRWINSTILAKKDFNSRPLVLIHTPLNHEMVGTGEIVSVHATARETSVGLRAVELWVNDVLVAEQPAPEGETPQSLLLTENWMPTVPGSHVVIVRATSADGVQGQATVIIEAEDSSRPGTGIYPVEEGDTLASIAEEVGASAEDLAALNPDLGGGEPNPGDRLDVPEPDYTDEETDGDGTETEETVPAGGDDGAAPDPEDGAPGDSGPFPDMGADDMGFTGEPTGLKLEVQQLRTGGGEESLHCYVSLANQATRRVPDADGDPSTDESFSPGWMGFWDVAPYLTGSSAPVVYWPDEESLPFETTCTGVAGGGTDALDMGTFDIDIPPESWDGSAQHANVTGAEGEMYILYRVSRVNDMRAVPLYLDPDMTSPTNVLLNDMSSALSWDYLPRADEEPITGFRVYLNGSLQWVEDASTRQSKLPPEWLNPPCGGTYTFAVTSYRFDLPDGPESPPGEASITTPEEGCYQQIAFNFLTLETYDLGSDGNYEDRTGDVGPPYGYFFVNGWVDNFNATSPPGGLGSLDIPMGLEHNTVYNLSEAAADSSWRFSMQPSTVVFLDEGERLRFGFYIMDQDTGHCYNGDDPGCPERLCYGLLTITEGLDLPQEGSILSTNGRCRVTYSYGPAPGSPAGGGAAGEVPLPWIDILDVNTNDESGEVSFVLHNAGSAAWSGRPLEVAMRTRTGGDLGVITYDPFELVAGQRMGMGTLGMAVEPPYDVCVMVDPNNTAQEYYEAYGGRSHQWYCPQLPDLVISDVQYDAGGGRMLVTVRNLGRGALEHRNLNLHWDLADGSPAHLVRVFEDISLRPFETTVLEVSGMDESTRANLEGGYSVYVDRILNIAESNEENNIYTVKPLRLKVWSCSSCIPGHYSGGIWKWDSMDIFVNKVRGSVSQEMFYVRREEYSAWDGTRPIWHLGCDSGLTCDTGSQVFSILEDEILNVTVDVSQGYVAYHRHYGTVTRNFTVEDSWGGFPADNENDWNHRPYCQFISHTPAGEDENWWTTLCILQLPE